MFLSNSYKNHIIAAWLHGEQVIGQAQRNNNGVMQEFIRFFCAVKPIKRRILILRGKPRRPRQKLVTGGRLAREKQLEWAVFSLIFWMVFQKVCVDHAEFARNSRFLILPISISPGPCPYFLGRLRVHRSQKRIVPKNQKRVVVY